MFLEMCSKRHRLRDAASCAPIRYSRSAPRSGDIRMWDRDVMADNERAARIEHENKLIRRLRFLVELTFATIAQDQSLTLKQAWDHVHALKGAAVAMFPGKDETFDLLYLPRFSRLLAERFRAN
jgi:hypothetical protein